MPLPKLTPQVREMVMKALQGQKKDEGSWGGWIVRNMKKIERENPEVAMVLHQYHNRTLQNQRLAPAVIGLITMYLLLEAQAVADDMPKL